MIAGYIHEWQDNHPNSIFPDSLLPIIITYYQGYDAKSVMIPLGLEPAISMTEHRMPSLQVTLEGKGSGTHTVLINLHEIAKSLRVFRGLMILKFIEMEIGELSVYSELARIGYIHGIHRQEYLQSILYDFVKEFVLCPQERCRKPETQYKVDRNLRLLQKCKACGWKGQCHSDHPLKEWVLNKVKETRDKEEKRRERKEKERKERREKRQSQKKRRDKRYCSVDEKCTIGDDICFRFCKT